MGIDELIEYYYRHPKYFRDNFQTSNLEVKNPLCGDRLIVFLENNIIVYKHQGCVLSNVGMAILCELYEKNETDLYYNHEIFKVLEKFPFREKCLKLAVEGYKSFLASISA